jgi:hypothetical protein
MEVNWVVLQPWERIVSYTNIYFRFLEFCVVAIGLRFCFCIRATVRLFNSYKNICGGRSDFRSDRPHLGGPPGGPPKTPNNRQTRSFWGPPQKQGFWGPKCAYGRLSASSFSNFSTKSGFVKRGGTPPRGGPPQGGPPPRGVPPHSTQTDISEKFDKEDALSRPYGLFGLQNYFFWGYPLNRRFWPFLGVLGGTPGVPPLYRTVCKKNK